MDIEIKGVSREDAKRLLGIPDQLDRMTAIAYERHSIILEELERIKHRLGRVVDAERQEQVDIAALAQQVTDATELDKSIKTLVEGIADELEHSDDPVIQALAAKLKTQSDALSAAVKANTTS